jgi:hypothetical protein
MNTLTRRIGVALTAALLATTAIAPMASARDWQGDRRDIRGDTHRDSHRGGDNGAGLAIGLGIAAIAGIALLSSANQAPEPVYQPVYPAYPAPSYRQPVYAQPAYAQPVYQPSYGQPSCTTINGATACLAPDGAYHYVR